MVEEVKNPTDDISQRGRKRKVTKFWEMEEYSDNSAEDSDMESRQGGDGVQVNSDAETVDFSDEEWTSATAGLTSAEKGEANKTEHDTGEKIKGNFYQFDLKPYHVVKSRVGRKVFKCDICSGVYRHSFSLKRHYIRNHINYIYVSKTDLLNCNIPYSVVEMTEIRRRAELPQEFIDKQEKENIAENTEGKAVGLPSDNNIGLERIMDIDIGNHDIKEEMLSDSENIGDDSMGSNDLIKNDKVSNEDKSTKPEGDDDSLHGLSNNISDNHEEMDIKSEVNESLGVKKSGGSELEKYLTGKIPCTTGKHGSSLTSLGGEASPCSSIDSMLPGEDAPTPIGLPLPGAPRPGMYRCNICEQLMDNVTKLKTHLVNHPDAPDNGKAFSCDRCDMKFAQKQNLMRHQAVHTGESTSFFTLMHAFQSYRENIIT